MHQRHSIKTDNQNRSVPWYQNRNRRFLLFNVLFATALFGPLRELIVTTWNHGVYTYIPFIPGISAYLIYTDRQRIFSQEKSSAGAGYGVLGAGVLFLFLAKRLEQALGHNDHLAFLSFSMIVIWIGGFMASHGIKASWRAAFPLLFLLFAVPLPDRVLDGVVLFLQTGSAEISYGMLQVTGMPIARDGFVFHLPAMDIEVAKECSGIRSSLALLITGTLAAGFFLRRWWARGILILLIVPIAIIKNSIRIASLTVIGVYIDSRILDSDLHRRGGFVFFIIALLMVGLVIVLLRRTEARFASHKR